MAREIATETVGRDIAAFQAPELLSQIRPAWQSRRLVERVKRLLPTDSSSACQRIFNAAVHDLREKVVIAGIDLAGEAAKSNKLPPVDRDTDVLENYSVSKLIDLSYRMGLLSRPEWRRLSRCYEIRRDLEHEDDEYEAGIEDCVYIFKTCIEVVLAKDPIHLIRVKDVKELVEQASSAVASESLIDDYEGAPQTRQEEILKFLVNYSLDTKQVDIVRQNAFLVLGALSSRTKDPAKLELGKTLQERIGKSQLTQGIARVAYTSNTFPFLRIATRRDYFNSIYEKMKIATPRWSAYAEHNDVIEPLIEVGALTFCPDDSRRPIVKWLVQAYLGEKGGRTSYGNVRPVYYSNSAAPLVLKILKMSPNQVRPDIAGLAGEKWLQEIIEDKHIARRWEKIVDLVEEGE